ncbi:apolipoprotein A-I-like [Pelobates fuscus]|uniref:apolipoprotein A-I-like n=1 Tax=Pelobates fuscus TaxID=191477 RepID=UPI002FE497A0
MRFVIVTLSLLFLSGTHGDFLWQHDEPKTPEQDASEVIANFLHNTVRLGEDVLKQLESSEVAKELHVKERIETLKKNANNFKEKVDDYVDTVWKEMDKEIHDNYPVLRTKVIPLLENFYKQWEAYTVSLKKDVSHYTVSLFSDIKRGLFSYFEKLRPLAESGRDKLRSEIESLRSDIVPYLDQLREELERNQKELKGDMEEKSKEVHALIDKGVDELRERFKPYLENLKEQVSPGAEELKKNLEKLLEEVKAKLYKEA